MANLDGFDANQHEPSQEYTVLPEGEYLSIMTDSEFKDTSKNNGDQYLKLKFEVVDGEHKGKTVYSNLNLKNQNQQAVQIAQGELSAICRAVGIMRPKDSSELHGKPLVLKVIVEPRNDKPGAFSNKVKAYKVVGAVGAAPSAPATPAQGVLPATSKPPWKK